VVSENFGWEVMDWINLNREREKWWIVTVYRVSNELPDSVKCRTFCAQMRGYWLLKKDSAVWICSDTLANE